MALEKDTYQLIFESCEEGILVVDNKGTIVMSNKSCQQMFGYNLQEMLGMKIETLIPTRYRQEHESHRKNFNSAPASRKMGVGRDLLGLRKDGKEFPVEASLATVDLGGTKSTVAYIIDITERKKIEADLRRSEEQLITYASELEKRVKERTEELEKINDALEAQITVSKQAEDDVKVALKKERELNELKSRFVTMASHEFRTPLSTILSSASLISKYDKPETTEKRHRHVAKIKSSIANMNTILNDFLSLAKLEEGKINLSAAEISVRSIVEAVVEEMNTLLKEGQQIISSFKGQEAPIHTDAKILKNILINLVSNAIKYSGKNSKIDISCHYTQKRVAIIVQDEGIGIPEDDQKHLFQRFFRAKNATNIQGTGLGLNIVKKYTEMLNGDISFVSSADKGSSFKIELPLINRQSDVS